MATTARPAYRVAMLGMQDFGYVRQVADGVREHVRSRGRPWVLQWFDQRGPFLRRMRRFGPAGVIAHLPSGACGELGAALACPVVSVAHDVDRPVVPCVHADDAAVGRLGAEHFLERGFTRLAFVGRPAAAFSRARREAFVAAGRAAGRAVAAIDLPGFGADADPADDARALRRWARGLGPPVGVMACNDGTAFAVVGACRRLGLRVPDDVAVLGVDDDALMVDMSDPPLSSVRQPTRRIGVEAAALLERMMAGRSPPRGPVLLPPAGVAVRQSTDVLAMPDADLAAAVRYIRDHADRNLTVAAVLRAVPMDRRRLERQCRRVLGRSPLAEIRRARVDRARDLLASTALPMPDVARRSGFSAAKRLAEVFRRETGQTPTAFRRSHRPPAG